MFKGKSRDGHVRELFRGSVIAFFLKALGIITGYLFTFLISKYYGAKGVGIYSLTFTVLTISGMIGTLGTQTSILRYVGQFTAEGNFNKIRALYKKILRLIVPVSALLSLGLILLSGIVANKVFHNDLLTPAFMIISLSAPFFVVNSVNVELIRGMKIIKFSEYLRNVNTTLFSSVFIFTIHFFFYSYYLPIAAFAISVLITFMLSTFTVNRSFSSFPRQESNTLSLRELFRVSLPMMTTAFSSLLMANISTIMLGIYETTEQVGIYSVSLKIATATSFVLIAINIIAAPKFSELYWSERKAELRRVVEASARLAFFVSSPILLAIVIFPEFLLGFFGKEFVSGKNVTIILAVGQFINTISGSVGYFLSMTGGQNVLRNIIISGTVLSICLNALLIPRYGITGAAFSTLISASLWNIAAALYIRLKYNISTFYIPFLSGKEPFALLYKDRS
jgi:O-antigen/teichoic acid export membrane protein